MQIYYQGIGLFKNQTDYIQYFNGKYPSMDSELSHKQAASVEDADLVIFGSRVDAPSMKKYVSFEDYFQNGSLHTKSIINSYLKALKLNKTILFIHDSIGIPLLYNNCDFLGACYGKNKSTNNLYLRDGSVIERVSCYADVFNFNNSKVPIEILGILNVENVLDEIEEKGNSRVMVKRRNKDFETSVDFFYIPSQKTICFSGTIINDISNKKPLLNILNEKIKENFNTKLKI